jgi:hypothetical protein
LKKEKLKNVPNSKLKKGENVWKIQIEGNKSDIPTVIEGNAYCADSGHTRSAVVYTCDFYSALGGGEMERDISLNCNVQL